MDYAEHITRAIENANFLYTAIENDTNNNLIILALCNAYLNALLETKVISEIEHTIIIKRCEQQVLEFCRK